MGKCARIFREQMYHHMSNPIKAVIPITVIPTKK